MSEVPLEVDCANVKARQDDGKPFLLLDVREPKEYALVSIPGSTLIPLGELQARVGELEAYREQPIVVHCHHGGRSLRATKWLREQGFTQVSNLAGGIDDWAVQIDPQMPRY